MCRKHVLAHQHRLAVRVGGDAFAPQHGAGRWHSEQLGIGPIDGICADRLGGAAQRHTDHLVERSLLHVAPAEMLPELGRTPHRHDRERPSIGEVEALHSQHLIYLQHLSHPLGRLPEVELHHSALWLDASPFELTLDRAELVEVLAHRLARHVPAEPLASIDQPFVAQDLQRAPNRDPTHLELRGEVRLAGQDGPHPHGADSCP